MLPNMCNKMCYFIRMFLYMGIMAILCPTLYYTEAFNIEAKHYTSHRKELDSMFGFSVAEYRDKSRRGWVIAGAPEAQTAQLNVYRGGAVYRCDIAVDDSCIPVEFDRKENNYIKNPNPPYNLIQIDNKTLQWFGASVSTSNQDGGPILACAPRYIFFSVSQSKREFGDNSKQPLVGNRRDPVGTCWVTNFTTSTEFSPCRTKNFGYHRQGSCQAGLGAAVSRDGERIYIGAPGSWYWQGQLYSVMRRLGNFPFVPPGNASFGVFQGQTYTQTLNNRGKVMFTKEGSPDEDDSYLGYSVTSGDFLGDRDTGTAVGMPRGHGLHGKVVLLTSNMTNHQNITGEQMGGYFGYALACGDIDGDGLDDLIVGAPMYTIPDNPEMNIETGRIYIFYGKGPDKYRAYVTRDGASNRGRFGLSLASLGDIDRDGYGDFAVGAPYAGVEGRGAVYIYHGSREGASDKHSQVIHAEDLSNPVTTFGFSIAGGLDLDGNLYPDMVVGAYESSTTMFFRSRPVIKMVPADTYVEFESASKLISLDEKQCILSDTTRVACLPLKACFKYTGDGVLPMYEFNVQYVLDVKKTKSPRLFFLEHEGRNTLNHTITVDRNQKFCRTVKVYITPSIRDKLTSLDAEMRMSLLEERHPDNRSRDPRIPLRPVLATTSSRKDTLSIRKNCGSDNICTPDLQLSVTPNVDKYLLGSGNRLEFDVLVQNMNEDAFEATYNLKLPLGVDYIKIERIDKAEIPVQCSAPKQSNNNTLKCDIGNPLPKNNLVHFNVLLQPVDVHDEKSSYEFVMHVNSTNSESFHTIHDNMKHFSLEIWVETELLIEGESKPKDLYYNPDNYTSDNVTSDVEYGPAFIHNYTIRNQGPSRIEEAEILLIWPAATLADDELIYLLKQPETSGPLSCATANANPLSLKIEHKQKPSLQYPTSGIVHEHLIDTGKTINVHTGYLSAERPSSFASPPEGSHSITRSSTIATRGLSNTNLLAGTTTTSIESGSGDQLIIHTERGGSNLDLHGSTIGSIVQTRKDRTFLDTSKSSQNGEMNSNEGGPWGLDYESHSERHTYMLNPKTISRNYKHSGGGDTKVNMTKTEIIRKHYGSDQLTNEKKPEAHQREEKLMLTNRQYEAEKEKQLRQNSDGQLMNYDTKHYIYGSEKHYENEEKSVTPGYTFLGDHQQLLEASESGFRSVNVSSHAEIENFLNALKHSGGNEIYYKEGKRYSKFFGRYRVSADSKEYLELKDGSMFPIQNPFGEQVFSSMNTAKMNQFSKMEGEIIVGEDGKAYCRINDNRRFPLQGLLTQTGVRTHNIDETPGGDLSLKVSHKRTRVESSPWAHESTNHEFDTNENIKVFGKHVYDDQQTMKVEHDVTLDEDENEDHGDEIDDDYYDESNNDNDYTLGYKRASGITTLDEFKDFEKLHRVERDHNSFDMVNNEDAKTGQTINFRQDLSGINSMDSTFELDSNDRKILPLCNAVKCVSLRCTLGRLEKDEEVSISARYRVKGTTLKKIAVDESVKISTQLVARVTRLPFIGKPAGEVLKSHEVYTNIEATARAAAPDTVPLWVVVLSACAGTVILLLLIFLLHKCGFFKRNRPTDAPERQPLNRNGHFQHGDDHL